jgi:transposase
MTNNTNSNSNQPPPAQNCIQLWIGLDWGDKRHAIALQDRAGQIQTLVLEHSAETLHHWLEQIGQRCGGKPVVLAIESSRGAVVHALLKYPWLTIYPINPLTSARYRQAFTPSGAKDDVPDAQVLLELVRDHAAKLRPLEPQDPQTVKLDALTQTRRDMVDRRTQCLNQLTSLLKTFYPQALPLAGNLASPMAREFLRRWPDVLRLKSAKPATVKSFYYRHNVRSPQVVEERLALIKSAVALTADDSRTSVAALQLSLLLDQLEVFAKHIGVLDKEIASAFKDHPEAALFRDLPGAGDQLAPRLCAAFGTLRHLYPEPASLQKQAGLAPVREKSGNQLWTHWRWQAPKFLRQTFVEWAGQTVMYSPWAKKYYQRMTNKGKKHAIILRRWHSSGCASFGSPGKNADPTMKEPIYNN